MKRIFKNILFAATGVLAVCITSCKRDDLELFSTQVKGGISVAASTAAGDEFTKSVDKVMIPLTYTLSSPATAAFEIGLSVNQDTIQKLIDNGTLPNTVLLQGGTYTLSNTVTVPYGATSVTEQLSINLSAIEANYGKKLAIVVDLASSSKGNVVNGGKKSTLVIVNTTDVTAAEEIHYVSFANTGSWYNIPEGGKYSAVPAEITIPLNIALGGKPGKAFTVGVVTNTDTLATLAAANSLPANSYILKSGDYTLPSPVTFAEGANTAVLAFKLKSDVIHLHYYQKLVFALTLEDPSNYMLDQTKKTILVTVDPSKFTDANLARSPYKGSPFVISGIIGKTVTLTAADYDNGGNGNAYFDQDEGNNGGEYRDDDVDIGWGSEDLEIGYTSDGEWTTYSVSVEQTGDYTLTVRTASPDDEGAFHIEFDGVNITGKVITPWTGGWGAYEPTTTTVHLTAGKHVMRFYEDIGNFNFNKFIFTRVK